jgi:hypothetical protein
LADTATALAEEQNSVRIGLTAVYCCFAGAIVIFGVAGYFIYQNKQVKKMELSQMAETKPDPEADQSNVPITPEKILAEDGAKLELEADHEKVLSANPEANAAIVTVARSEGTKGRS